MSKIFDSKTHYTDSIVLTFHAKTRVVQTMPDSAVTIPTSLMQYCTSPLQKSSPEVRSSSFLIRKPSQKIRKRTFLNRRHSLHIRRHSLKVRRHSLKVRRQASKLHFPLCFNIFLLKTLSRTKSRTILNNEYHLIKHNFKMFSAKLKKIFTGTFKDKEI